MAEISEELVRKVRLYVFGQSAESGRVPQAPEIAKALGVEVEAIGAALKQLALGRVLILAPNDTCAAQFVNVSASRTSNSPDASSSREIATFGSKNSTNGTVSILPHEGALAP